LGITIEGLADLIRRVIRKELAAQRDGWLTSREAADYLGISLGTLHNLVSSERLPRHGETGARRSAERCSRCGGRATTRQGPYEVVGPRLDQAKARAREVWGAETPRSQGCPWPTIKLPTSAT
jgi:excisionase family DNA binding protein